jgi:hypothetical protein
VGKDGTFCALARRDVENTMEACENALQPGQEISIAQITHMIQSLMGSQITLLRAIEEVEQIPWWRRRRFNAHTLR